MPFHVHILLRSCPIGNRHAAKASAKDL